MNTLRDALAKAARFTALDEYHTDAECAAAFTCYADDILADLDFRVALMEAIADGMAFVSDPHLTAKDYLDWPVAEIVARMLDIAPEEK